MFVNSQACLMVAFPSVLLGKLVLCKGTTGMDRSVPRVSEAESSPLAALLFEETFQDRDFSLIEALQGNCPSRLGRTQIAVDLAREVQELNRIGRERSGTP